MNKDKLKRIGANLASSAIKFADDKFNLEKVHEDVSEARIKICEGCPRFRDEPTEEDDIARRCLECGGS